ncbi:hypothetical protein OUZ56_005654 [Daphnia magna]|uniref:Uncharacterized protein n=1 Tax=Daphnia magna TaxID=35525 RepID=A0ABQ9YTE6_9CRUS|nr:hypothetical protein OUZ56_005654 [Daphnia magna]
MKDYTIYIILGLFIINGKSATPFREAADTQGKNAVHYLKGGVKCSLAHLVDVNYSGNITATLAKNNSLQIEWTLISTDCIKFSSGVWI